jgi:hypothetical protein
VDESATGSVNFWSDPFVVHCSNGYFGMRLQKFSQIARRTIRRPLRGTDAGSRFSLAPSTERE